MTTFEQSLPQALRDEWARLRDAGVPERQAAFAVGARFVEYQVAATGIEQLARWLSEKVQP